jgi:hypothetical protein
MCLATGGQPLALSTVHFECSADTRLVEAGGTLVNLAFGELFWVAARAVKQTLTTVTRTPLYPSPLVGSHPLVT